MFPESLSLFEIAILALFPPLIVAKFMCDPSAVFVEYFSETADKEYAFLKSAAILPLCSETVKITSKRMQLSFDLAREEQQKVDRVVDVSTHTHVFISNFPSSIPCTRYPGSSQSIGNDFVSTSSLYHCLR